MRLGLPGTGHASRRAGATTDSQPVRRVRLYEPEVGADEVVFRWEVTPPTELYKRSNFRVSFPSSVDLSAVPSSLWWRVLLLSLHAHWALLRPCRVELPVSLGADEREFWMRLIDNASMQVQAYGGVRHPGRAAQLIDEGPLATPEPVVVAGDRGCVAFSGGKDSLVLTALLAELIESPVAVTITSPVAWARDHVGAARDRARSELTRRLGVETIEVRSDFRTSWEMAFSAREGCSLGVHELSDLPLYHGVLAAVAAARGLGGIFMASEADIQYTTESAAAR
jgi:hypothetical protein